MSEEILANSSAIIIWALNPLIFSPVPKGIAIAQLSPSLMVHLSTSLLGPSSLPLKILLAIGAFLHSVSIYSKITLLCLKAAPTITILVPGTNIHFKNAYKANKKDFPKPLLATNIGNGLVQNSCIIAICIGCSSISNSSLHVAPKYWGSFNILNR